MARKSRTAVLKRQREVKKAEKAALKREKRQLREEDETGGQVATQDDLAGYGFSGPPDDDDNNAPPAGAVASPRPPRPDEENVCP